MDWMSEELKASDLLERLVAYGRSSGQQDADALDGRQNTLMAILASCKSREDLKTNLAAAAFGIAGRSVRRRYGEARERDKRVKVAAEEVLRCHSDPERTRLIVERIRDVLSVLPPDEANILNETICVDATLTSYAASHDIPMSRAWVLKERALKHARQIYTRLLDNLDPVPLGIA